MALAGALMLLFAMMLFALSFDVGAWFFDHNAAQRQAEAAAIAAVTHLAVNPDVTAAKTSATQWLERNGAGTCNAPNTCDIAAPDSGGAIAVRVTVRRQSPAIFAGLAGIAGVRISASATSRVGPVGRAQVLTQPTMPFAIAAQDPDCDSSGDPCSGVSSMCSSGATFEACPWGLDPDALFLFDGTPAGIAGFVEACGPGTTNHVNCVDGDGPVANGFDEGPPITVTVVLDTAAVSDLMHLTVPALETRAGFVESPVGNCDETTAAAARTRYRTDVACRHRVVLIPIVRLPGGTDFGDTLSGPPELLGVATFGIAGWDRSGASEELWGYLMGPAAAEVHPPGFRLQRIAPSSEPNPLAPKLIALVK